MADPKNKQGSKKKPAQYESFEDMPLDVFRANVEEAKKHAAEFVATIHRLFPGLVTLTKEQRAAAPRLRDGEHAQFLTILQVVDLKPQLFESLADNDEGMDPHTFETGLLRDRIEKHRLLRELADELAPLSEQISDTPLYLAGLFRDALAAAYRIAKAHAETDKKIRDILAPVIDFMRRGAVTAAKRRNQ
jgi:hypothetical protein